MVSIELCVLRKLSEIWLVHLLLREISSKHTYELNVNNTNTSMIFLCFFCFSLWAIPHTINIDIVLWSKLWTYNVHLRIAEEREREGELNLKFIEKFALRAPDPRPICIVFWANVMTTFLRKIIKLIYFLFVCLSVSILREMETAKTKLRSCKNKALTAIRSLCLWPIWLLAISYLFEVFSFIAKQNTLSFIQFPRKFPRFLLIIILFTNTFVDFHCIRFFRHKIRINQSIQKYSSVSKLNFNVCSNTQAQCLQMICNFDFLRVIWWIYIRHGSRKFLWYWL